MPQKGTGSTASRERNQGMVDKVNGNSNGKGTVLDIGKISNSIKSATDIGKKLIKKLPSVIKKTTSLDSQRKVAMKYLKKHDLV